MDFVDCAQICGHFELLVFQLRETQTSHLCCCAVASHACEFAAVHTNTHIHMVGD